jgi:hypothetical protein
MSWQNNHAQKATEICWDFDAIWERISDIVGGGVAETAIFFNPLLGTIINSGRFSLNLASQLTLSLV